MKRSAMLRAFQVLKEKPMILLLIFPMQALSAFSLKFLPDFSSVLNLVGLYSNTSEVYSTITTNFMIFSLINSLLSMVTFAGTFLLVPPAIELLRDGAAGRKTESSWYMRGLRLHWWKPIVSNMIVGAITGVVFIVFYVLLLVLSFAITPLISAGFSGMQVPSSGIEGPAIIVGLIIGLIGGSVIGLAVLIIKALFAMFLPALADRSFGGAFKLMFSRKGLRKFFRAFGGLILISLVPSIFIVALGAAYIALTGIPGGTLGIVTALCNFLRSWTGVFGTVLCSLSGVVTYAFEFCLFQQVKEEEDQVCQSALPSPLLSSQNDVKHHAFAETETAEEIEPEDGAKTSQEDKQ